MTRRPITRIFVANPPVPGKRRRKAFEQQFQDRRLWPYDKKQRLPPVTYAGVNALAVKKPWVRPIYTTRIIREAIPLHSLIRPIIHRVRFLFPESFRARHPVWLKEQEQRFDEPQLR